MIVKVKCRNCKFLYSFDSDRDGHIVHCPKCKETYNLSDRFAILTPPTNKEPSLVQKVFNLTTALASFVSDGCTTVDSIEYERRLLICDVCDRRKNNTCSECGCYLLFKAKGRAFTCPIGKW